MTTNINVSLNEFITDNHDLVFRYLDIKRLDAGEFYDVVVFGFMEAARRYLQKPELRAKHCFEAIAFTKMNDCMSRYYKGQKAKKRHADLISLERCSESVLSVFDDVDQQVFGAMNINSMLSVFDNQEQDILALLMDGQTETHVAQELGITKKELSAKRANIRNKAGLLLQPAA